MTTLTETQQRNLRIKCAEALGFEEIHQVGWSCRLVGYKRFEDGSTGDDELEDIPTLTYETLRGVIERMDYSQQCIFVDELCHKLIISRRDFRTQDCLDILTAPVPTIALCVAKAKGWEI